MNQILKMLKSIIFFDTYGYIASASFLICLVSGILLIIPYDVSNPYDSISIILLTDPASNFIRNIHYWSAQLFLVFTIIHIWDHFNKNSEGKVKSGVWLRLVISMLFVFYAMLSGFILKADADSMQAKRILSSLFELIPIVGDTLSVTFLGNENNYQIVYLQHAATASIFLIIIIFEHAKTLWTKITTSLYTLLVVIIFSYFITPGLHDNLNPIIKGPWYFLGLQELLHWIIYPEIVLLIVLLFFVSIYLLPKLVPGINIMMKRFIVYTFTAYFFLTLFAYFFRGENWELQLPWNNPYFEYSSISTFDFGSEGIDSVFSKDIPVILGRREGCVFCHSDVKGFSNSHNPQAIGCFSCHLGNPFTLDKDLAHKNIVVIAGGLETAKITCGANNCHPSIPGRIDNSIMNTLSGMISVNKFVFDEIKNPSGLYNLKQLKDSPADSHLRNLCVSCHISNAKELGPISELTRGGGCSGCHLNYSKEAQIEFEDTYISGRKEKLKFHPSLDINITNNHCFGCHSRSGRISTNYEGWHETNLTAGDVKDDSTYRILEDERVFEFIEADIHYTAGMQCIDCHTSYEIMGDGNLYEHKENQLIVECIDCHSQNFNNTIALEQIDAESKKIAQLRKVDKKGRVFLATNKTKQPLLNTRFENNTPKLDLKLSAKTLELKPPLKVCIEGNWHQNLSCNSCHGSWAPQCIGCHTEYNPDEEGFDLLLNKSRQGIWEEHVGEYFADQPVLGIKIDKKNSKETVDTFIPGMILSLNKNMLGKNGNDNTVFKRLYSPAFSHTVSKNSRSCKSCHNNPLAIGYGRGNLIFNSNNDGRWEFLPMYINNKNDNLPEDAWIGFLTDPEENFATRNYVRPFTLEEQKKILTVGTCFTCHDDNSKIFTYPSKNFEILRSKMSTKCLLPSWEK